jgi:peptidoglycan/LPS O-acetylase OafA/YrhL
MEEEASRTVLVDVLKAVAPQFIVLHHLAFYGPMSDAAHELAPDLINWLSRHGRLAVQVFLVVGGYLAVRSLSAHNVFQTAPPFQLVWRRYCRLALPLMAAVGLAVLCAAIARAVLPLESTPAAPGLMQLLAHLLLLQDLLGFEALSAGVWYVAIDFQLYALLAALLWLSGRASAARRRQAAITLVSLLAVASLFHFNRIAAWDHWALYFFAAYALGVLAFFARESGRPAWWLVFVAAVVAAGLALEFRGNIALALLVAVPLGLTFDSGWRLPPRLARLFAGLGDISYSVFLVHYPVCLVVNAAFGRFAPNEPVANLMGMALAWVASLGAGALFHRQVERRCALILGRRSHAGLAAQPSAAR